jgi:hypothetical protein
MWPRQQWHNNWNTIGRSISHVTDQGFIGETGSCLQGVLGGRQPREVHELRDVSSHPVNTWSVLWRLYVCYSGVTFGMWGWATLEACWIWGSPCRNYERDCLFGCRTVYFKDSPNFCRTILHYLQYQRVSQETTRKRTRTEMSLPISSTGFLLYLSSDLQYVGYMLLWNIWFSVN